MARITVFPGVAEEVDHRTRFHDPSRVEDGDHVDDLADEVLSNGLSSRIVS